MNLDEVPIMFAIHFLLLSVCIILSFGNLLFHSMISKNQTRLFKR